MEFRFIRGMEIYWTSLGKFMIIKDKHLLLLIHTGRNVFICRMSLKLHFYHQGNWEDWNVRPFWEFFFWLWVWLKWDELCALCMKQVCICHLFLSSFSKFVIFSCCCDYLVSWLEYDYLLMVMHITRILMARLTQTASFSRWNLELLSWGTGSWRLIWEK